MMEMTQTSKPKFKHPNKHIPPGFFERLRRSLKNLSMRDVVRLANQLNILSHTFYDEQGNSLTVEDVECIEGSSKYASDSRKYWFYGGPEIIGENSLYTLFYGSILDWLIDNILFRVSFTGMCLLETLEIEV